MFPFETLLISYLMLIYVSIAGRIKELLEAQLNVPISRQELRGWVNKNDRNLSNNVRRLIFHSTSMQYKRRE